MTVCTPLLDVRRIYAEAASCASPRGRQVLERFPGAEVVDIASHWRIPELHGDETNIRRWSQVKRTVLVLGTLKSLRARPNGRSSDFIAPSTANGCAMACSYCYVGRRKGAANPITVFTNIEAISGYLERHVARQGVKAAPNQCDPEAWVYDIGENSDCSVDAMLSDNVADLVGLFRRLPTAKASFATKYVNRQLLAYDPQGRTRIRFSLMPPDMARRVDLRTSPVSERIAAINDFVAAGYEVHVNFSPVIVVDGWLEQWRDLFGELDDVLSPAAKMQMKAEVIFLTHNEDLHDLNLQWHPTGEMMLWRPEVQERKRSQTGGLNVRYRSPLKRRWLAEFEQELERHLPWCQIRYAF